jgi:hypothetical protein
VKLFNSFLQFIYFLFWTLLLFLFIIKLFLSIKTILFASNFLKSFQILFLNHLLNISSLLKIIINLNLKSYFLLELIFQFYHLFFTLISLKSYQFHLDFKFNHHLLKIKLIKFYFIAINRFILTMNRFSFRQIFNYQFTFYFLTNFLFLQLIHSFFQYSSCFNFLIPFKLNLLLFSFN